jgi:hypothetical protein
MSEQLLSSVRTRGRLLPGWSMSCALLLMLGACVDRDAAAPVANVSHPSSDYVYTYGTYQLVGASDWNAIKISNSHLIGREGGRLTLGLDELVVPPGAVKQPTTFTMTREIGPHIMVELNAFDRKTGAVVDTFDKPVELKLSYRFARVSNPERLVVLWLKDARSDGELVPMPTTVLPKTKYIVGSLMHFSQFAMGLN